MAYYVIADIDIHEADTYAEYQELVPATIELYGGRYLVRGGEIFEPADDFGLHRVVMLEFPSKERALQWEQSTEYAPVKAMRESAAITRVFGVEGV